MYKIHNFDTWDSDIVSGKYGSGASEKEWLIEFLTNRIGLFKYPKIKDKEKNIITSEYLAEKIASELAKIIGIKCNEVDIGYYKGRIGTMSYNFVDSSMLLNEGVTFIEKKYLNYNKDKLIDETSNEKYTLQMIINCLPEYKNDILLMIIFDALIGNSDRHHSNWGIIYKLTDNNYIEEEFSPLYDNGSSLCAYVNEEDIDKLFKDKMMYNALLDTKSKSAIGWKDKRPIRHFELIKNIRDEYYNETIEYVKKIKNKITKDNISALLNNFSSELMSEERKKLLFKFILDRRNKILEIYNLEENDEE